LGSDGGLASVEVAVPLVVGPGGVCTFAWQANATVAADNVWHRTQLKGQTRSRDAEGRKQLGRSGVD
jgi:hypothetical protein